MAVEGSCDPRFEQVREEFERNFAERGEVGASVSVSVRGETVVDLWGGLADPATGRPWVEDTINVIMSSSKGASALCVHLLIDRGQLELDAPIAAYWPEFAKNGKADITVRMALSHTAGVPHVRTPVSAMGLADWDFMIRALEDESPFWSPGTRHGYHGVTIGLIQGELVRRITGRTIGKFFAEEVAGPLGLDFFIGLPEEQEPRVAPSIAFDPSTSTDPPGPAIVKVMDDPNSVPAALFLNLGDWANVWDTPEFHAAELPSIGGVSNARSLAGMYTPLANSGAAGSKRLVSDEAIARMRCLQVRGHDEVLQVTTGYSLGFSKSCDNTRFGKDLSVVIGEDAFGAPGAGGQMGLADTAWGLSFGYTMTRHGGGTALNERGQSLIDVTYRALRSTRCDQGFWARPT